MVWSEAIFVMILTHAKWRDFTDRPIPPTTSSEVSLALALDNRDAVDAMVAAAALHGGTADVNPVQDHGFMYGRDLCDPDGHVWEIGRAHVCTPVPNAHLVCRLLPDKKKHKTKTSSLYLDRLKVNVDNGCVHNCNKMDT